MMMGAQFQPDNSVAEHAVQDEHGNTVMLSQMVEWAAPATATGRAGNRTSNNAFAATCSTSCVDWQEAMVEGYFLDQDWGRHHHHYCPKRKAMEDKGDLFVSYPQTKRARALREMRWFGADLLGMATDEVVEDGLPWWHEGEIRKHAAKDKGLG
ncbi:hypothetical protein V8C86DRAFT_2439971 [Haematococcus lacustris]